MEFAEKCSREALSAGLQPPYDKSGYGRGLLAPRGGKAEVLALRARGANYEFFYRDSGSQAAQMH